MSGVQRALQAPGRDAVGLKRFAAAAGAHKDLAVAAGLFLLGALSRIPFVGSYLYHWDSVNFAFALDRFDVAAGQPHVPGYILYVGLGRLVDLFLADPQKSLVAISIAASGGALAALYVLGREFYDRQTGLLAALLLASSPLFWFYGEVALPHTLDAMAVIVAVFLLLRVARGDERMALPAAVWLGLAGGLRPQTQVFLAPLMLYAAWRLPRRLLLKSLALLVVIDLAWLLPLLALSGGPARYLELMAAFTRSFNATTSIFTAGLPGLRRNLVKLGMYTLYGWGAAAVPALAALPSWWMSRRREQRWLAQREWLLLLWGFPVAAYYALIHMGQQGLVFVYLPALMLLSAAGLRRVSWGGRPIGRLVVAGVISLNASIFIFAPTFPLGTASPKLLTRDTLRRHDASLGARIQAVEGSLPRESTALISAGWRFPQYYLPRYALVPYFLGARWEVGAGRPSEEGWVTLRAEDLGLTPDAFGRYALVLFDPELLPFNGSPGRLSWEGSSSSSRIPVLWMRQGEVLRLTPEGFSIEVAPISRR